MGLTKVAIQRPVFILMLMLVALLIGGLSWFTMRSEESPDVELGVITIQTIYPGAGPDEVNNLITRPVEESVSGVANLQTIISQSVEGASIVTMQFDVGADMSEALNEVRSKVDAVVGSLPREVERPVVNKFDFAAEGVVVLAMRSDQMSNRQLRDLVDNRIKDRFARIGGVAAVQVSGGDEREIQVRLRRDKLLLYGIGIAQVQQAVQFASLNIPSGRMVDGDREFSIRVSGEFASVEDIEDMSMTFRDNRDPNASPKRVRLGDIAHVADANVERRVFTRLDGSEAVTVSVLKAKEGNAVEIADAILGTGTGPSLLNEIESQYAVQSVVVSNLAVRIQESLNDLLIKLFFSIFLVTLIVFVFLHDLRGTLIVGISIPVSIGATIIVYNMLGYTLNNMTLLALMLAVVVLVDDSIVVLENIFRHLKMGEHPVQAAINGRGEIGLAAIAITLADIVVFAPIAFIGGIVGQFFRPFAIGFMVCVMISLLVCFTVTPMLAARWYREGEEIAKPKNLFSRVFEDLFERFTALYGRQLDWTLRHRWAVFCAGSSALFAMFTFIAGGLQDNLMAAVLSPVVLFFVGVVVVIGVVAMLVMAGNRKFTMSIVTGTLAIASFFPISALMGYGYSLYKGGPVFTFQFFPPNDTGAVQARIELAPGTSLAVTEEVVERVEQVFMAHPDVKFTLSSIGTRGAGFAVGDIGPNFAQVSATLYDRRALKDRMMFWVQHDERLRDRRDTSVAADLLEQVGRVPGANVTVAAREAFGFGAPIQLSFRSDDRELLLRTAVAVQEGLARGAVDGVISPELSSKPGKPEIHAVPDRARLAVAGVSTAEVGNSLRILYEGNDDAKFRVLGREYPIRVMMDLEDRNNPDVLNNVPIAFSNGQPIFLSQVTDLKQAQGVDKIQRRDREEEIVVSAELLPGLAAGTMQAEIDNWMQENQLIPEGVRYQPLGQADFQARESLGLFVALILGLILVYAVLASLFNNLVYPFIIQLAQPQALVGALLALILTDRPLNLVGFIGIIALAGLVGKNGILLVDYANTLRERGRARHQALVESGMTRLRPIMMTSLAIIFGLMPVALAVGRGSEFRETIGITIIGGTILSTALTLFLIPCSYTIFDDLAERLKKKPAPVQESDD